MGAGTTNLENLYQNANKKRSNITDLTGATYAEYANVGITQVVSAAANVNGIVIRHAQVNGYGGTGYIAAGTNKILHAKTVQASIRDIMIPAGQALNVYSDAAAVVINMFYQVL